MRPAGFPWRRCMQIGFAQLRLAPDAFWAMTPRELLAASRLGDPPLRRADFDRLAKRFSDQPEEPHDP